MWQVFARILPAGLFLTDRQHLVVALANYACNRRKRHLSREHKHEGFKQQREAIQTSCKVRLHQAHCAIRQLHPRSSHLKLAFMLKEVKVPVGFGYLWSFVRVFVRTPSGRQRFNVLGALNAVTKELVMITNETYITSVQVCELMRKLATTATLPITLVLDNARYQRCAMVQELAIELNIVLLFLPPYSPNLNLIERLWKLVKKECLYNIYYENFALFRGGIENFLSTMSRTHQRKLDSLLTLNFQSFTQEQFQRAA